MLAALEARNDRLARFWLQQADTRPAPWTGVAGRRVLVIDCEDTFTSMLGRQLTALGLRVKARRFGRRG